MRSNDLQQPWTYPRYAIEVLQAAERPLRLPISQDRLGQAGPDPGQSRELLGVGAIDIDAFVGVQWARLPHGAIALRQR
jgi:hypothetical protein